MNGKERYFNTISFERLTSKCSHGPVVMSRPSFAGGSWGAGSNRDVATFSFFFPSSFFYPLGFYSGAPNE